LILLLKLKNKTLLINCNVKIKRTCYIYIENFVDFFSVHRTVARDFKEGMGGMGNEGY